MDVNGTKFHLLLTRDDWANCSSGDGGVKLQSIWKRETEGESVAEQKFDWDDATGEITLQKQVFKFTAAPKDEKPKLENRRGAARDRYGNWYWIDESSLKIKVLSVGSNKVSDFYPAQNNEEIKSHGDFQPLEKAVRADISLRGLAVTIDHYLIAGTLEPASLLIFDLFAGGEPRRILWHGETAFAPFDIAARRGGGAFVLDRANKRCWTLDRDFNPVAENLSETEAKTEDFQPVNESEKRKIAYSTETEFFADLPETNDPISIEALPDDTFLILDSPPENEDFSIVYRYYRGVLLDALELKSILSKIEAPPRDASSPPKPFRLRGFDFAFLDAVDGEPRDRLFIVSEEGNQAFSFRLICRDSSEIITSPALPSSVTAKNFELQAIAEYFPIRLFGGKGFSAVDGRVYYDFGERWLPLTKQNRPSFEPFGTIETRIFDGKEPNCVWHRLLLDACLPPETRIEVYSRAAESEDDLRFGEWQKEPPLYLRRTGSELPFSGGKTLREKGKGTWELLLQNAKNRYLQLKLEFSGNGRRSPRVSALRVYYPRFSYLNNYLPAIYRDDEQSAFFLDRFLANIEGFYTGIEDRIAAVQMLFDVRSAPAEALEWLADWLGAALDPAWSEDKRRLFISRAVDFYQYRGTMRGIRIALRLALDNCADESIFEPQTTERKRRDPIRIVERFQTRRAPEIIPSEASANQNLPRVVAQTKKWQPFQGADVLNQRYGENFTNRPAARFSLIRPENAGDAQIWERFAHDALGFVPSDAATAEQKLWRAFLREEYQGSLNRLNQSHTTNYKNFDEIPLPRGTENNAAFREDWREFIEKTTNASRSRKLWQDFLARRYRRVGELNDVYATNWSSFEYVSLFDRLPSRERAAADWLQFESGVLPMHQTAHRFTVLIPALLNGGQVESVEEQNRKLELVRRVVDLEKPSHTTFDFRFYWNLFRLDEVRLGLDTLLGLGSRDPLLNPELIIGQSFIGESRLGTLQPEKNAERYVLGNEFLEKK